MTEEEVFALLLIMLVPMCDPYSARMPRMRDDRDAMASPAENQLFVN
jgi:hypothetical protein